MCSEKPNTHTILTAHKLTSFPDTFKRATQSQKPPSFSLTPMSGSEEAHQFEDKVLG
eukprot:m.75242 g.75242  ORF g.75242 m.75242 type:complete len:57 (+) comp13123_c6_seq2:565-735(+)